MNYQYLIVGNGMTAAAVVDGVREVNATGSIGIVSAELRFQRSSESSAISTRRNANGWPV